MQPRLAWIGWLPLAAMGIVITAVYVSWFVAYSELGRRPLPSSDDPKFIGGMATFVYHRASRIIFVSIVGWAAGMITNIVITLLPRTEQRMSWLLKTASGIAAMVILIVMVRHSPGDACNWFLD